MKQKRDSKQPRDIMDFSLPKRHKKDNHSESVLHTMIPTTKKNIPSKKQYPIAEQ